jgi:nicotinamide-nucleotide amidase
MKSEIITIGDELMSGEVLDTNFSWLAEQLWTLGCEVHWHTSVRDDPATMAESFKNAQRSDLVIVTGGLGPTSDDRTLAVAAETFARPLEEDSKALEAIKKRLQVLGRDLNDSQAKQAMKPQGSTMFPNVKGTAPGCRMEEHETQFIFLVGVPSEMKEQWSRDVVPFIRSLQKDPYVFKQKIFRCFGSPEAELEEKLKNFSSDVRLSYRLKFPEVLIKVAASSAEEALVNQSISSAEKEIREKLGRSIYAVDDNPIEKVINTLLTERNETVAIAESCTGGLISHMLTEVSGSSAYLDRSFVTYSNQSKVDLLGVSADTIEKFGAVSSECVLEMAQSARERAGTDYALAVSGIAGPSGGTDDKPVGTVYVALATPQGCTDKKYFFPFGRHYFKEIAAHVALHRLRRHIEMA